MEIFDFNDLDIIKYKNQDKIKAYKIFYKQKSAGKIILKEENLEGIVGWFLNIELNQKSRSKRIGRFALIKILYEFLGIKIYANVKKSNVASRKVLEILGFKIFLETKSSQLIYMYDPRTYDLSVFHDISWNNFYKSVIVDIFVFLGNPSKKALRIPYLKGEINLLGNFLEFCKKNNFYYFYDQNYLIISKIDNTNEIYSIDISLENHVIELGEILGYPKCCTSYLGNYKEEEIDSLEMKLVQERKYIGAYRLIDLSGYYNGISLVSHIPCSSLCNESLFMALLTKLYMHNNLGKNSVLLDNKLLIIDI